MSKCNQKKEMLEWNCLESLSSLINGNIYNIYKMSKEGFFNETNDFDNEEKTNSTMKKLKAEYKKNDTILHNYNLAIKYFEIVIQSTYKREMKCEKFFSIF